MDTVRYSIIVPVYNSEKYIEECVKSVECQTFSDWELLLVDDGSEDNSGVLCDSFATHNSKISSFHKVNGGQTETRRFGVEKAKGDYCLFLDSDDTIQMNALETLEKYLNRDDIDCGIFGLQKVKNGLVCEIWNDKYLEINTISQIYDTILSNPHYNSLARKVIKRTLLGEFGENSDTGIRHGEDLLESVKILRKAEKIILIPEVLYNYRYNENSVTNSCDISKYLSDSLLVNSEVLKIVVALNCFDDSKFKRLSDIYIKQLIEIIRLAIDSYEYDDAVDCFVQIKESPLYQGFISKYKIDYRKAGAKSIFYHLFVKDRYSILYKVEKIYRRVSDMKR